MFKVKKTSKATAHEKFGLRPPEPKEITALKDETLEAIRKGKQSRLPVKRFNVSERKRQLEQSAIKEKQRETKDKNHFYVIDFETTGKKKPEPICVAAIRYEKGQRKDMYKTYFMPDKDIDAEAEKLHKFTKWRLKANNSRRFSKTSAELLINFLNKYPNIPIVAHAAKYDRDMVLMPALSRVNMQHMMPPKSRWRCTLDLSDRCPDLFGKELETIYTYFGYEERADED